jgi:hypothetical protein
MRFWTSAKTASHRLRACVAAAWLAVAGLAQAAGIELRNFTAGPGDDGHEISVNADFELPQALETLLEKGVTLTFRVEVEITRPRWWWFNERVTRKVVNHRLSYQTLTRQYRLSTGEIQHSYATLQEALRKITRIRNWTVAEKAELKPGSAHEAIFRIYHDVSQLPKPLQVTAFANTDWELSAEPRRWTFIPEAK